MNVHEYQAKEILREFGVPVPAGVLATTPAEAEDAARELGTSVVVVKAQVHAGGRGKAGGIRLASTPAAAEEAAAAILSMQVRGFPVHELLVEEAVDVGQEIYLDTAAISSLIDAPKMILASGSADWEII